MAAALKTFFSRALVRRLAKDIVAVHPQFSLPAFVRQATTGLEEKELLDRARHIARALADNLPRTYPRAIEILLRSLGPELASEELLGAGMAPFFYLPHTLFVAERGLDHFDVSMRAQYELTKRCSAELSIRSFIARDPERTFAVFRSWAGDGNPHVRRLVSEGTRLRLPWASRVGWLDEHPGRVIELLDLMKDDPASLVRRSVANNLNDLGAVKPELLIRTCASWLDGAPPPRRALIAHALRGAVRRGSREALDLLGYTSAVGIEIGRVRISPRRIRIGERVTVRFAIRNTSRASVPLVVQLAVTFATRSGRGSRRVFMIQRTTVTPLTRVVLRRSISLAVHTTRVPEPGEHRVEIIINGEVKQRDVFVVLAPSAAATIAESNTTRSSRAAPKV
jgi:3-methyladenine DNA glycosylase AlkC